VVSWLVLARMDARFMYRGWRGVSGSFVSLLPGSLVGVVLLLRLA